MQSRLEEEEDAKVALMSRIQRLTKLILVSSKNTIPGYLSDVPNHQRSHSVGEDDVSSFSLSLSLSIYIYIYSCVNAQILLACSFFLSFHSKLVKCFLQSNVNNGCFNVKSNRI